jgi:hypothetical protein
MPLFVPLHSIGTPDVPPVPLPVPAVADVVPAVADVVPAVADVVPALLPPELLLMPATMLAEPDVLVVPAVVPLPPSPSSGVFALEQPAAPEIRRNPTDAIPAYTLIMIASHCCGYFAYQFRRRPSP